MIEKEWYTYIVECVDGTLYTGITTDLSRRINEHGTKKGAKYTRYRTPIKLIFWNNYQSRSLASKEEYRIKRLTRVEKLELIKSEKNRHDI